MTLLARVRRGSRVGLVLMAVGVWACGGDSTGPDDGGGGTTTLTLSPTSGKLRHPGDTLRLSPQGSAASGAVTWSTSDPSVATVSGGLVTATGYGQAQITASAGGKDAVAPIVVTGETSMDFLEGTWTVADEAMPAGAASDGKLMVVKDQSALRAVWRGTLDGAPVEIVYLVVRRGDHWTLALADGVRGTFAVMDGDVSPGTAAFDSGDRLGGSNVERARFTDFTSSSVRWIVEESDDGGSTWSTRWSQLLTRTATQSPPAVLDARSPACQAAEYAQFDFWIGDWKVRVKSGGLAGTNLVHRVAGCGVQENWRDASSGGGVSLSMYDPRSGKWTQIYVASTGGSLLMVGRLIGDQMVLDQVVGGLLDRTTWTLLEDGRVRQYWEEGPVNGTLAEIFDGYYGHS